MASGTRMVIFAASVLAVVACDASFEDLRSSGDGGGTFDAGFRDVGPNVGTERVLSEGTFSGVGSYSASGMASIVSLPDGTAELRFGDDFDTSSVPGPVVVLAYRDEISPSIDTAAGDVEIGALKANSGGQVYPIPANSEDRDHVWIFCKPFGVDISQAVLTEVP